MAADLNLEIDPVKSGNTPIQSGSVDHSNLRDSERDTVQPADDAGRGDADDFEQKPDF